MINIVEWGIEDGIKMKAGYEKASALGRLRAQ